MTQNVETITCRFCETVFERFVQSGRKRLYCSIDCRRKADNRRRAEKDKKNYFLCCAVCGADFVSGFSHAKTCGKVCQKKRSVDVAKKWKQKQMSNRPATKTWLCGWCNSEIIVPISYTGSRTYHDQCRVEAKRAKNRRKNAKRRGAVLFDKKVSHELIAQRDDFVCYLCGDVVDMSLPRTSRMGATLDHVVPVSRGGQDVEDNLKLTHWICNIQKSDSLEFVDA